MRTPFAPHDVVRGHDDIPAGGHTTIQALILTVDAVVPAGLMVTWTTGETPFLVSEASVDLVFHHGGVR